MNFNAALILISFFVTTASCAFEVSCKSLTKAGSDIYRNDSEVLIVNVNKIWRCGRCHLIDPVTFHENYEKCINAIDLSDFYKSQVLALDPVDFKLDFHFNGAIKRCSSNLCENVNKLFKEHDHDIETVVIRGPEINWSYIDPNEKVKDYFFDVGVTLKCYVNSDRLEEKFKKFEQIIEMLRMEFPAETNQLFGPEQS